MSAPGESEAYESLLEQGLDLQRRHDALLASRTWRMQLAVARALRSPGAFLGLPADLWRILRSKPVEPPPPRLDIAPPPEPLPSGKPLVLALVPWLQLGGAERVIVELIRGLRGELDFAVLPASPRGPMDPAFAESGAWIFPPPESDYARRVAEIVRTNNVRCVLVSSCPPAYEALPALRQAGDVKVADILHNTAPEGSLSASVARDAQLDLHFAVGEMQAEALRTAGIAPEKIVLARNGVDCEGRFRPSGDSPREAFTLGWVGRLSEEKDPLLFLRTLPELRDCRGLMIGDGPERFRAEALVRELGLRGRVRITGFTPRVADHLAACDVLLLTSRVEGSPLTILEAMSLEKPVIAADVGGVRETVEDGVTGLLVRERSPQAFAAAVRRFMADESLRRSLAESGRRRVVERYSMAAMLAAYRGGFARLGLPAGET
jgi:glycosyltransferase involved in cell wall biosynthesis